MHLNMGTEPAQIHTEALPLFLRLWPRLVLRRPRGSRGRLGRSVIRVASAAEPSLSAVTGNPSPGFGFGFEAGDLLGMAARPDGHYAPFVPCLYRLGIDPDALMRFGHARHYAPWPSRKPAESGALLHVHGPALVSE